MEDFATVLSDWLMSITTDDLIAVFLKAFAILFSIMYLLYAVIITRQTQVMNKTVNNRNYPLFLLVSFMQIVFAGVLILAAITLL
jgi:hypothetical protein